MGKMKNNNKKSSYEERQKERDFYRKELLNAKGEMVYWGRDGVYFGAPKDYLELFKGKTIPLRAPLSVLIIDGSIWNKKLI